MTAARELATFCRALEWSALSDTVRERTAELILDFFGVALGGSRLASSQSAAKLLYGPGRQGPSIVIGGNRRALPEMAALLNGTSAHGTELDDVTRESSLHPGVAVIPAALAIAESSDASVGEFALAMVAGYEVTLRVGNALGGAATYRRGFHPTSVAGTFGAAMSAGLLLGLDENGLTNAMGIAGTMAAGSLEFLSDGSWTKRLNAGWAAHSGVVAAQLAAAGFTGPATVFEGPYGTLRAYTDAPVHDRLLADLGDPVLLMTVAVKPYACCRYNHGLIDAVLALRQEEEFDPTDVRRIRLGVLKAGALLVAEPIDQKRRPRGVVEAQLSAPYAAAVALIHGRAGMEQYTDPAIADPRLEPLMARTECYTSPDLDAVYPRLWPASVEIELSDGRTLRRRIEYALGEPENWISREALLDKFNDLAGWHGWSLSFAERLLVAADSDSVLRLTEFLASGPDAAVATRSTGNVGT